MTNKSLITHPIAPGYELIGDDGSKRSICPKAKCTGVSDDFKFFTDHNEPLEAELLGYYVDDRNLPVLEWNSDNFDFKKMKGTSPHLGEVKIDETTGFITEYELTGLSIQIDQMPICPGDTCTTTFKGGKDVTKDENGDPEDVEVTEETEEIEEEPKAETPPKKAKKAPKKKKTEKAPKPDPDRDEYIAKMIRENEGLKKRNDEMQKVLKDIEDAKRAELVKLVPEEHREYADGLEMNALEKVVSILGEKKDAKDKKKIVEGAGSETTDQKPDNEETTGSKDEYKDFFNKSDVIKTLTK
jgi:hypothetical protein